MAKDFNISKTTGQCTSCQKDLPPGDEFVATVRELGEEFGREDYCVECWENGQIADSHGVFAVWRSRVDQPQEKKKLFVDDELLINFFERLADADEDFKISFRFVLALVLMRKKLLVYDRMERADDGEETWLMHFRGGAETHHVIDPKMDAERISEVSGQLGQILEGEL